MNKDTISYNAWVVSDIGRASNFNNVKDTQGARPVIKVTNSLTISGGNGTWKSPYQI